MVSLQVSSQIVKENLSTHVLIALCSLSHVCLC